MIRVYPSPDALAQAAAAHAAESLRGWLQEHASKPSPAIRLLGATGASQLQFLEALGREPGIDRSRVELFHLDEYAGIGIEHPASFARYIKDRLVDAFGIRRFHLLNGLGDPDSLLCSGKEHTFSVSCKER